MRPRFQACGTRLSCFAALLLVIFCLCLQSFGQEKVAPTGPPKELVEYIRDAKKSGQNEFQIQQNAVKSGWPEGIVNEAITYVRSTEKDDIPAASNPIVHDKDASAKPASGPANPNVDETRPSVAITPAGDSTSSAAADAAPSDKAKSTMAAGGKQGVSRGVPDDYRIGAGDVLEINVWKEPDATVRSVVVRPDGKISMPLLKEVDVVGLTPVQLEKLITEGLSKLINLPDVTIVVTGINSKKIYVTGKVKKEGPISFTYRMTVMQALSEAGGINDYAKKKAIYVLRNENGREFRFPFDYSAVLKGQRMDMDRPLEPGDVIVVP
jgi:polysaccharide export outer membrane protein